MDEWFTEHGGLLLWGAVLGVVGAAIVSYIFYRVAIRPKKVDWLPIGNTQILQLPTGNSNQLARLELTLDGKKVENARLVIIRIVNTGSLPVTQQDFDPPISVSFGDRTVLRCAVIGQSRRSARIVVEKNSTQSFGVSVSSLNRGDWFDIQFLTDSPSQDLPSVQGQLIGRRTTLRNLTERKSQQFTRALYTLLIVVAIAVIPMFYLVISDSISGANPEPEKYVVVTTVVIILAGAVLVIMVAVKAFTWWLWRYQPTDEF